MRPGAQGGARTTTKNSESGRWPRRPSVGMGMASRASVVLTSQRGRGETDHFPKDCFWRTLFNSKQRESLNFFLKKRNRGESAPGPTESRSGRQPRADVFNANRGNEHRTGVSNRPGRCWARHADPVCPLIGNEHLTL